MTFAGRCAKAPDAILPFYLVGEAAGNQPVEHPVEGDAIQFRPVERQPGLYLWMGKRVSCIEQGVQRAPPSFCDASPHGGDHVIGAAWGRLVQWDMAFLWMHQLV